MTAASGVRSREGRGSKAGSGDRRPRSAVRGAGTVPAGMALLAVVLVVALASSCDRGATRPAQLDTRNDACAWCRMSVSDGRFAGQLVAPGEEPLFFDDIGCLRDYLKANATLPKGSAAFVADHRTKAWVPAGRALYARVETLQTPMSSHLVAHESLASRDADPETKGGAALKPAEVFGPTGLPGGAP